MIHCTTLFYGWLLAWFLFVSIPLAIRCQSVSPKYTITHMRGSKTDSETICDSETTIQKLFPPIQKPSGLETIAIQKLRFRNYHDSETIGIQKLRFRNYSDSETTMQKLLRFRNYRDSETITIQKLLGTGIYKI